MQTQVKLRWRSAVTDEGGTNKMKRKITIALLVFSLLAVIFLPALSTAEGGLLPSLSETVGIAMPSLGEALGRYPDEETENGDGSITELYINVSESDFETFSVYLQQENAELADYKAENGVLTAEIRVKNASLSMQYDSKAGEVKMTYPSGTFDEWAKNADSHYKAAQALIAEGKTTEAYSEIFAIPQFIAYRPVDSMMKKDKNFAKAVKAREENLASCKIVGSIVTFGTYPQSSGGEDQTPIEWIVLDYDELNHRSFLLSRYGLDNVQFNTKQVSITWEKCTLRSWLNNDFLNHAFSEKEQKAILTTEVNNRASYSTKWVKEQGGNNTKDQIFLLNYAEASQYLGVTDERNNNTKAFLAPTPYAIARGARESKEYKTEEGKKTTDWWLRSSTTDKAFAARVDQGGAFNSWFNNETFAVRPAFWLDLNVLAQIN